MRNYTYCYDKRRHNPVWVAYPHHRCYLEGSGRSDEPWAADPALPETQQAKIYPSSAGDVYQYLVTGRYGSGYWSRGHLCMSRERPGKGLEINMQTFRPTNIAPQAAEPSPFGKIWGNIEEAISGGAIPADTLYIVAGCYYENDGWVQKDASNNGALSSLSKDCVMPTHQFKMAVRKKTVQVGKPIQECILSGDSRRGQEPGRHAVGVVLTEKELLLQLLFLAGQSPVGPEGRQSQRDADRRTPHEVHRVVFAQIDA